MSDFICLIGCLTLLSVSYSIMVKSYCRHKIGYDFRCINCGVSAREILRRRQEHQPQSS